MYRWCSRRTLGPRVPLPMKEPLPFECRFARAVAMAGSREMSARRPSQGSRAGAFLHAEGAVQPVLQSDRRGAPRSI